MDSQTIFAECTLVEVQQGWLRGKHVQAVTGEYFYSFKGIPYAKPPLGSLRFKAPEEPESWEGVRNATENGAVCPQINLLKNFYVPGSEDCLFLNVFTPNVHPPKPLPVMFYIHGGLFKSNSGDDTFFGPDFLISKNVIVVTINYRLDAIGFLSLETKEVPGNAGLKDQVLALQWVNRNIKQFGGDLNRITMFGQSAGAASIVYHMVSPMSKGLFQRGILQSGVPNLDCFYSYKPRDRAFKLGRDLGFETKNTSELLTFLQSVPTEKLINTTSSLLASEEITSIIFKLHPFVPVIEKDFGQQRFVIEDPFKALETGNVNKVDVLCGYTSHENLILMPFYVNWFYIERYNKYRELFVPTKILFNSPPDVILYLADKIIDHYFEDKSISVSNMPEFINYATASTMFYDVHRFFRRWPQVGTKFFYKFSAYSARNMYGHQGTRYGIYGSAHTEDLLHLFYQKDLDLPFERNSKEYKIIQLLVTVFTNFAKYGNPTPDSSLGVIWPQFDNTSLAFVNITDELEVGSAPDEEHVQFWKTILEYAGITF
ncbi:unnamed protein product [Chrysodeixis includens]|uniref:Carboxylesterase type B domain-containing protein n=1 Tax=Chrysodeixis includens TaxID=689277 RepID=A0A9P0BPX5_CHRIL|nr:unnamed protein product [Chrysodeixis includens]